MLRFTWLLEADGFSEKCDVQLLCRHAARRGVHLPKAWKSKWNQSAEVPAVDALARAAVQRAREELSLSDATKLDCRQSSQAYTHTYDHEHKHAYLSTLVTLIKVCW